MLNFRYVFVLSFSLLFLFQCSKKQPQNGSTTPNKHTSSKKWIKLPETLDYYDEVFTVKADFKLEIFINSEKQSVATGKYVITKVNPNGFISITIHFKKQSNVTLTKLTSNSPSKTKNIAYITDDIAEENTKNSNFLPVS